MIFQNSVLNHPAALPGCLKNQILTGQILRTNHPVATAGYIDCFFIQRMKGRHCQQKIFFKKRITVHVLVGIIRIYGDSVLI